MTPFLFLTLLLPGSFLFPSAWNGDPCGSKPWSSTMNAPMSNPLMSGLLSVLFVQTHLRSPQTPRLTLHSPSDLRILPGAVSNLWGKGQWDSNIHSLTSLKHEIWNYRNNYFFLQRLPKTYSCWSSDYLHFPDHCSTSRFILCLAVPKHKFYLVFSGPQAL